MTTIQFRIKGNEAREARIGGHTVLAIAEPESIRLAIDGAEIGIMGRARAWASLGQFHVDAQPDGVGWDVAITIIA